MIKTKKSTLGRPRFTFGGKRPPAHKNRAKIHHFKLQHDEEKYDNDYMETYYEDSDGELVFRTTGINKKSYELHSPDYYDRLKDGE